MIAKSFITQPYPQKVMMKSGAGTNTLAYKEHLWNVIVKMFYNPALHINFWLGWKCLPRANTLAYYEHFQFTVAISL
jgi:hypothetical protein